MINGGGKAAAELQGLPHPANCMLSCDVMLSSVVSHLSVVASHLSLMSSNAHGFMAPLHLRRAILFRPLQATNARLQTYYCAFPRTWSVIEGFVYIIGLGSHRHSHAIHIQTNLHCRFRVSVYSNSLGSESLIPNFPLALKDSPQ